MAWRPYENLIDGELDNTVLGKVTGHIRFYRKSRKPLTVTLDLAGDFHEDIRGSKIRFANQHPTERDRGSSRNGSYMDGMHTLQKGQVGDMTAGLPVNGRYPYVTYPYIEWYSDQNGRVVLELEPSQLKVVERATMPALTDAERQKAYQKREQAMGKFLHHIAAEFRKKTGKRPVCIRARVRK